MTLAEGYAFVEVTGLVTGSGPAVSQTGYCDPIASVRVDREGRALHLRPGESDFSNATVLVVWLRVKFEDPSAWQPDCSPPTMRGYRDLPRNVTWSWRGHEESASFDLEGGDLVVNGTRLQPGGEWNRSFSFEWTRPDGAGQHYEGALSLHYHGLWPRAQVFHDKPKGWFGFSPDEALWKNMA